MTTKKSRRRFRKLGVKSWRTRMGGVCDDANLAVGHR